MSQLSGYIIGTGTPEGAITADPGAQFIQTDGSPTHRVQWVKLTGTGNTGWVQQSLSLGTSSATAMAGNDSRVTGAEQTANKGAASGYAGLDSGSRVAQAPKLHHTDHSTGGADAIAPSDIGAEATANKGANSGYMGLDSSGVGAQTPKVHAARHQYGGADALALSQYDRTLGQVGVTAPMLSFPSTSASVALTASRAYFCRFVPSRDMSITKLVFVVTTAAGADDACDVGIYSSALTRLGSAGATTGQLNSTGIKTITVTAIPLVAGTVYYAAFSVGTFGGTAAALAMTSPASGNLMGLYGTSAGPLEGLLQASAHPLPSPAASGGATSQIPILAVRES